VIKENLVRMASLHCSAFLNAATSQDDERAGESTTLTPGETLCVEPLRFGFLVINVCRDH
jgi:hypothetical protein